MNGGYLDIFKNQRRFAALGRNRPHSVSDKIIEFSPIRRPERVPAALLRIGKFYDTILT
jgi:hypothetical protein